MYLLICNKHIIDGKEATLRYRSGQDNEKEKETLINKNLKTEVVRVTLPSNDGKSYT